MPNDLKHVAQMNGVFVMDALNSLRGPVSLYRILKHIAKLRSLEPYELREQIKAVVETGVKNGFIKQNEEGRYYVGSNTERSKSLSENLDEETEDEQQDQDLYRDQYQDDYGSEYNNDKDSKSSQYLDNSVVGDDDELPMKASSRSNTIKTTTEANRVPPQRRRKRDRLSRARSMSRSRSRRRK